MKAKALILFFITFLFAFNSNSQNSAIDISFGQNGISIPDTVVMGDSIWFSCWVVNSGGDVLAENILLKAARHDANLGFVNTRTIGGQGPNFMSPDDSIQFVPGFLFEVVTNQNYLVGDNIVVIWPKADVPNTISQTNQYIYTNVHVLSSSILSISEETSSKAHYFYPQPAKDKIYFNSSLDLITSLKIFNILGKEVACHNISVSSIISISHLPQGLYVLRMQTEKGEEKIQKLIIKR